jgi:hypothetical protein
MNTEIDQQDEFQHLRWTSHYVVEPTPAELNDGDKIVLPSSALEQLLAQAGSSGTLPSPLTFELRHPHSGATIHCGVKEFSTTTTTQLPTWIMQTLKLNQGDRVLIKLDLLPKGTFARLQPLSIDYRDITDYRAALEAHLRGHYTTLTQGQVLSCRYGGRSYAFEVLELLPQKAVSITDTDLEVDMEPIKNSDDNTQEGQHITKKSNTTTDIVQLNQSVSHVEIPKNTFKYWKLVINNGLNHVSLSVKIDSENTATNIGKNTSREICPKSKF